MNHRVLPLRGVVPSDVRRKRRVSNGASQLHTSGCADLKVNPLHQGVAGIASVGLDVPWSQSDFRDEHSLVTKETEHRG